MVLGLRDQWTRPAATQALSAEYLLKNRKPLDRIVYDISIARDRQVVKMKLESMGIKIERLTVEQEQNLSSRLGEEEFRQTART